MAIVAIQTLLPPAMPEALAHSIALITTQDRRPPAPAAAQTHRHLHIPDRRLAPVLRPDQVLRALPRLPTPLRRVRTLRRTQATALRLDQAPVHRHNQRLRHRIQVEVVPHSKISCRHNLEQVSRPAPFVSAALFYTFRVQSEAILEQKPPEPDLRFPYGQDPNQFVDVRIPAGKGPHPIVFFIHGGYWRAKYNLTYAGHLCHALKKAGIATWNIEYRRVGNPGGGWPGTFEDVRSAYRALREHRNDSVARLDLKKLCVAGHSAGGHLALCLAAFEHSVTHVLSLAGVLDLRRAWELHLSNDAAAAFLGGSPADVPDHYREASPAERAIPQATQKLIHGTADGSVPYEISQSYVDKKKTTGEHVELITFQNIGHFEIVDPTSSVWKQVENSFIALTRH
jgi:acetyl esterase/lipase